MTQAVICFIYTYETTKQRRNNMIENYIRDWAESSFYESETVNLWFDDVDFYVLHNFVCNLNLDKSVWRHEELMVQSVKSYDQDGNSEYLGVLTVSSIGKKREDFLELAEYFDDIYSEAYLYYDDDLEEE